jgi:hypothetical protein
LLAENSAVCDKDQELVSLAVDEPDPVTVAVLDNDSELEKLKLRDCVTENDCENEPENEIVRDTESVPDNEVDFVPVTISDIEPVVEDVRERELVTESEALPV